jgi:AcrR family transcriptional regulator
MNGRAGTVATPRAAASPAERRRQRRVQQTRQAVARAACELVLERGWQAVTIEEISDHAEISRRTFSRHFTGKEDALAEVLRTDLQLINDALATRPPDEPPLTAYHHAVRTWLGDQERAWHRTRRATDLLRLVELEPEVRAAYLRVRQDAEARTAEVMARRMRTDPLRDRRPALAAAVAGAAFGEAVRAWIRSDARESLAALVDEAFEGLASVLRAEAPQTQTPESRTPETRTPERASQEEFHA